MMKRTMDDVLEEDYKAALANQKMWREATDKTEEAATLCGVMAYTAFAGLHEEGHDGGSIGLMQAYEEGMGMPRDHDAALALATSLAEKGPRQAKSLLLDASYKEALDHLQSWRRMSDKTSDDAVLHAAMAYQAFSSLYKERHINGAIGLLDCYEEGVCSPDHKEIFHLATSLAKIDNPPISSRAKMILAKYYFTGVTQGDFSIGIDSEKSRKFLDEALNHVSENMLTMSFASDAMQIDTPETAINNIAHLASSYATGLYNQSVIMAEPLSNDDKLLEQANHHRAIYMSYPDKKSNEAQQAIEKVVELFHQLGENNNPTGQFFCCEIYAYGIGVKKDLKKAAAWKDKAIANGYVDHSNLFSSVASEHKAEIEAEEKKQIIQHGLALLHHQICQAQLPVIEHVMNHYLTHDDVHPLRQNPSINTVESLLFSALEKSLDTSHIEINVSSKSDVAAGRFLNIAPYQTNAKDIAATETINTLDKTMGMHPKTFPREEFLPAILSTMPAASSLSINDFHSASTPLKKAIIEKYPRIGNDTFLNMLMESRQHVKKHLFNGVLDYIESSQGTEFARVISTNDTEDTLRHSQFIFVSPAAFHSFNQRNAVLLKNLQNKGALLSYGLSANPDGTSAADATTLTISYHTENQFVMTNVDKITRQAAEQLRYHNDHYTDHADIMGSKRKPAAISIAR